MTLAGWDIPDLEALMRTVLRLSLRAELGDDWLKHLPAHVGRLIEDNAKLAARKRPQEQLRGPWDAAGMPTIRALLAWKLPIALNAIWPDPAHAEVDLSRLASARDKRAHVVGPPLGQITEDEVAAMVTRLRVGFEEVRRRLEGEVGDWWPYLASVHSNVVELCWERSSGWAGRTTTLNEGDLVTLDVVGVNPNGPTEDLRYDFRCIQSGGVQAGLAWDESNSFRFEVPRCRTLLVKVSVGTAYDIANVDTAKRQLPVRPSD